MSNRKRNRPRPQSTPQKKEGGAEILPGKKEGAAVDDGLGSGFAGAMLDDSVFSEGGMVAALEQILGDDEPSSDTLPTGQEECPEKKEGRDADAGGVRSVVAMDGVSSAPESGESGASMRQAGHGGGSCLPAPHDEKSGERLPRSGSSPDERVTAGETALISEEGAGRSDRPEQKTEGVTPALAPSVECRVESERPAKIAPSSRALLALPWNPPIAHQEPPVAAQEAAADDGAAELVTHRPTRNRNIMWAFVKGREKDGTVQLYVRNTDFYRAGETVKARPHARLRDVWEAVTHRTKSPFGRRR